VCGRYAFDGLEQIAVRDGWMDGWMDEAVKFEACSVQIHETE